MYTRSRFITNSSCLRFYFTNLLLKILSAPLFMQKELQAILDYIKNAPIKIRELTKWTIVNFEYKMEVDKRVHVDFSNSSILFFRKGFYANFFDLIDFVGKVDLLHPLT